MADGGEVIDQQQVIPDAIPEPEVNQNEVVPDLSTGSIVPDDQVTPDSKHGTAPQQALTALEGLGQGIAGPVPAAIEYGLSKLAPETAQNLSLTPEDMAARQAENPKIHAATEATGLIGGLLTGTGEAALVGKAMERFAPAGISALGKVGSAALQGALTNATVQGGDEATGWILGQGDPGHAVGSALANIGAAGLFGLAGGAMGQVAGSKLQDIINKNVGSKISPFLEGVEQAARGKSLNALSEEANITEKMAGSKLYHQLTSSLFPQIGGSIGAVEGARSGYEEDGLSGAGVGLLKGAAEGAVTGWAINAGLKPIVSTFGKKFTAPILAKILSSGTADGLGDAINYATTVKGGYDKLDRSVGNLFKIGTFVPQQAANLVNINENRDKLDAFLENGGVTNAVKDDMLANTPPMFAEGGDVEKKKPNILDRNSNISIHFPEQGMLMAAAKSRISNYLNGLRPVKDSPKLAFDDAPDNTEQKRSYNKALDLANDPMEVLNHVQAGTLEPDHVKHLTSMYPEVYNLMGKTITDHISKAQLDGTKPTYKVRQSLSLLLGTALSGDLVPQNIQAAQNVFSAQQPPASGQQAPVKNKKNTSTLSKVDDQFLTPTQAAQRDQQNRG